MPGPNADVHSASININNESSLKRGRLWGDLPHVMVEILGDKYPCLADTGCTTGVISEALFQTLRTKDPKMQVLPTAGIVCSGALKRQKQRVKYQVMVRMKVGTGSHDIVFLVVPGLGPEIILGLDLMETWQAILDFGRLHMCIKESENVEVVPFIEDAVGQGQTSPPEAGIESELFFVQRTHVYDGDTIAIVQCVDPGSYEQNFNSCYGERGLFLYSEDELNNVDQADEDEIQILSVDVSDRIDSVLIQKVYEINDISDVNKREFYRVLRENFEVFSDSIGLCKVYTHEIHVENPTPYSHKCRPVPIAMLEKTDQAIQKMLDEKIIEKSDSEFVNALCLVRKTDGSVRVTIDARQINSMTSSNHYRSESVQAQLNKVNGAKWFTIIDLTQSFLQVPLKESCRKFTAFLHRGKQYRFTRTPFGLASSSAALARALDKVFGEGLSNCVSFYVDDAVVFSDTIEQHIVDVGKVLNKLKDSGFTIKPGKLQLGRKQVEFLGYIISEDGVRPHPAKIGEILDLPTPRNQKQLRRFFGIVQYQSRFLVNYAQEAAPLRILLKKGVKWNWTPELNQAFIRVKNLFARSVLLQKPDYSRGYTIFTDASIKGISGILTQEDDDGERRVISTVSRALTGPESRMFITEIEVAAIYFALEKFRDYIFDQKVVIKSDNISLAFLQKCKLTSSRISRYIHEIMSYNIEIQHIRGTDNVFADTLSRLPRAAESLDHLESRDSREIVIMRTNVSDKLNLRSKFKDIGQQQRLAPELMAVVQDAPEVGTLEARNSVYGKLNDILYKKTGRLRLEWKVYIPDHMAEELIRSYHEHLGHSGTSRVILALEQSFYIKRLARKCRKIVGSCMLCLRAKPINVKYQCTPACILRDSPNALVCVDIHGKLPRSNFGYEYIFVMYDVFTKFTKIYPLKKISTRGCLNKIVSDYIPKYGPITALLSDNASLFSSPIWRTTLQEHHIKCYPISNSSERRIRDISIYLRAYCHISRGMCIAPL